MEAKQRECAHTHTAHCRARVHSDSSATTPRVQMARGRVNGGAGGVHDIGGGVGHGGLLGRGGGGDVVEVRVEGTVKHRLSGLNHSMG